jgi:predicted dehydrogenase
MSNSSVELVETTAGRRPASTATTIAVVGCGYVFDHYLATARAHPELRIAGVHDRDPARAEAVARYYGLRVYPDLDALAEDPAVELVVNLTSIESHYAVTKRLLEAGKHVYSEKPITTELEQTEELFALAAERGLVLAGAPGNVFSDTVQTMWKAVRDGAVGRPLLVYAEFDDNPVYLMRPEEWRSRSGAPWPYLQEYEQGCTVEHVGYHLVWICALFGPAQSVTAFSSVVVPHKTDRPLDPSDTPDFSVACIQFADGLVARITCSIAAPADHRMRIIGDEGELWSDTYRHYQSPVRLERFTPLSLNARKLRSVRLRPALGRVLGVGGRHLPLVEHDKSFATQRDLLGGRSLPRRAIDAIKRREIGAQDKLLGVALTARALREGRPSPLPADFITHINELTLAIQRSGPMGSAVRLKTSFEPLQPLPSTLASVHDYRTSERPRRLSARADALLDRLHKH